MLEFLKTFERAITSTLLGLMMIVVSLATLELPLLASRIITGL